MNITTIVESMMLYGAIITDDEALVDFYAQGNCFVYEKPLYAEGASFIHAYPGIHNNNPVFFMIPAEFDSETYAETIQDYVTMWPLQFLLKGNRLPPGEATDMIDRWGNDYAKWIPFEIKLSTAGMFKAFAIPGGDFEIHQTEVYLALKEDAAAATGYKADIVVTNIESTVTYYDDFAEAVPPFPSPSALSSGFYLLSLAEQ